MRIAVLTSSYPRFAGDGTAPFVQSISEHMAALGHEIEVVAPYDPAVQPSSQDPVKVHRFRYIWPPSMHIMGHARALEADAVLKPLAYVLLPFFLLAATYRLMVVTGRQKSQVIHAHWVLPNGLVAAWVASFRKIPFIISLHGSDIYVATRNRVFKNLARWIFDRATGITACSQELKDAAIQIRTKTEIHLLAWGADPQRFFPREDKVSLRRGFGWDPEAVTIVALGRLVHKKGFSHLIQAFAHTRHDPIESHLVIGGEGPLKDELAAQVASLNLSERVTFPGRIPWDQVPDYLAAGDIFVLPSVLDEFGNMDGLPTVLLEAMSCGLVAVASMIGGVPLVIQHNHNGLLVPPGDPQALAQAISALLEDPQRRKIMGAAARQAVLKDYNWENVAKNIIALMRQRVSKVPS